ncbi:MAG: hypothetical protein KY445_10915 [Armatimonadetes bacterium]|nr:hypothetical protein [Armatimonadota bacterium]
MKRPLFAIGGLLCLMILPAKAQNAASNSTRSAAPTALSLSAYLQMSRDQIGRFDRQFDAYAARRSKQEATLFQLQGQLAQAQAPTSFNERKASRLLGEIGETRQKVAADLLSSRAKALEILGPVQRSQLQSLTSDPRFTVQNDRFYQLLLLPVENLWQNSSNNGRDERVWSQQTHNSQPSGLAGRGSYGVYGGYSYGGPSYGVYGSYGQGPIGVHAGVGRGGVSVGIGIGGIFGGGRRFR